MHALADPILFHADNPGPYTGDGNSTWLIDGPEPTLVDAGVGQPTHLAALRDHLAGRALHRVLITHGHPDHVSGANALRALWPVVELCKLAPPDASWRGLVDGEQVCAGDTTLTVVATPGHAVDHACFWDSVGACVYTGDMLMEGASVLIPAGNGGDLRLYLASLDRLLALAPRRAFPGHGPAIAHPADVIAAHIQRRKEREADVLACLDNGVRDLAAIVARLYPNLPSDRLTAARMTVMAHLDKLRAEGRLT